MLKAVVIGAINWDINLFIKNFPREGEEVVVKQISRVPGGKGGNVAVAAARLLGPGKVAILGGLGTDPVAKDQARIFEEEGVLVSGLKFNPEVESGQAYIVIDEAGENMIHTYFGANATVTPEDLDEPIRRKLVQDTTVVTIMDPLFETAVKLAQEARRLNKIVTWDPGVKAELGAGKVQILLKNVDYVVANEIELENLGGTKDLALAAKKLIEANKRIKVVGKFGARGAILYHDSDQISSEALDLESHGMRVVNTVGCGDAFLGAFVAALCEGRSDMEALRWGNCAGGLKATKPETRGSPDRQTMLRYLV